MFTLASRAVQPSVTRRRATYVPRRFGTKVGSSVWSGPTGMPMSAARRAAERTHTRCAGWLHVRTLKER